MAINSPTWAQVFGTPGDGSSGTGPFPNNFYSAKQFWGASPATIPTSGINPSGGQGNNKLSTKTLIIIGIAALAFIYFWHWNYNR